MDRLLSMQTFVTVVDTGSFVAAADRLGVSKAATSRHVADLESLLGVRLLQRTTRRLSLTEEGRGYVDRCREILDAVDAAEADLSERSRVVRGVLRVNAPVSYGIRHLAPLWGDFQARYPELTLDVTLSDRNVDLVEEGFDVAIRIGALHDSSLVARKLATTRIRACASPGYLAAHGVPSHPADLVHHRIVGYSYWAGGNEWTFTGEDGPVSVRTQPQLISNNGETCVAAAIAGQGIALQPDFLTAADLASGALVELLPDNQSISVGIHAVYPSRRHLAPKVQALLDYLVEVRDALSVDLPPQIRPR